MLELHIIPARSLYVGLLPFANPAGIVHDVRLQYRSVLLHVLPQIIGREIVKQISDVYCFIRDWYLGESVHLFMSRLALPLW